MILRFFFQYTIAFNFLVRVLTEMCLTFLNMLVVTELVTKSTFV